MEVRVFLLDSARKFDKFYTYLASETPESSGCSLKRGMFVSVPFGKGSKLRDAIVWDILPDDSEKCPEGSGDSAKSGNNGKKERKYTLKTVASAEDTEPLTEEEFAFCSELSGMYACTLGESVRAVRPFRGRKPGKNVRYCELNVTEEEARNTVKSNSLRSIKQIRIIEYLLESAKEGCTEGVRCDMLMSRCESKDTALKGLEKKGLVRIFYREEERDLSEGAAASMSSMRVSQAQHELNGEQQAAFDTIMESLYGNNERKPLKDRKFLLHGVTGSGKTEIYLHVIAEVLKRGDNAMMLVPEISLTPQMVAHFTGRFGSSVAVIHSGLTQSQKAHEWQRIEKGAAAVAIGARSCVFAPFKKLRLIIMDEAHDSSYSSTEGGMRYNTDEVAALRLKDSGVLVMGTATPDVTDMYHASEGKMRYLKLSKRAGAGILPEITVADMRSENPASGSIFGTVLKEKLIENRKKGMQAIIFVGRRGFSSSMSCMECGRTMKCGKCNMAMTFHASLGRLICHYCGNTVIAPVKCPACGSPHLNTKGVGTERVQEELMKLFPGDKVLRIDSDTTSKPGGHARILGEFAEGKVPFLVGTQMITKGHDFPKVTLVGVIQSDSLLNQPEYNSCERAFQILTQVSGRAGRSENPGEVVIQAYGVDEYAITAAKNGDYDEFYRNEIKVRKGLVYPPFCDMITVCLSCEDDRQGYIFFRKAAARMAEDHPEVGVYGPARAGIPKINGKYRWQIHIKARERQKALKAYTDWFDMKETIKEMKNMQVSVITLK